MKHEQHETSRKGTLLSGRREFLAAGISLATAPLVASLGGTAAAQQSSATSVGHEPFSVSAYGVTGANKPFEKVQISRRAVGPKDVLLDVLYCGICHSDIHAIQGGLRAANFPLVPGHEAIGRVIAVGSEVTKFKVGDIGGVGCMVSSCRTCDHCAADREKNCLTETTFTYNSPDRISGGHTFGGYSDKMVVNEHFVIRIPPGADLAATAPLLCAGVTTFSPMQHWKLAPGQRVGIVGLGGLGHMALKLGVARGAQVTVFTTSPGKIEDAKRLGAKEAVLWTDAEAMRRLSNSFDLIITTVPEDFPMQPFVNLLKLDATLVNVGAFGNIQEVSGIMLMFGRKSVAGSIIGGIAETQEVIDYCFARGIKADIELIRPDHIDQAYDRVIKKDIRYRFVIDMASAKGA